jgi:hypothetical protein
MVPPSRLQVLTGQEVSQGAQGAACSPRAPRRYTDHGTHRVPKDKQTMAQGDLRGAMTVSHARDAPAAPPLQSECLPPTQASPLVRFALFGLPTHPARQQTTPAAISESWKGLSGSTRGAVLDNRHGPLGRVMTRTARPWARSPHDP